MQPQEAEHGRNSRKFNAAFAIWTLVWTLTLALARFGPELLWNSQPVLSGIAVAVNLAAGVGWIVATIRLLRGLDDLERKIMLDALGMTLGVGWVMGFGYVVADGAGLIPWDISLGALPALMGVVYIASFLIGKIRYR